MTACNNGIAESVLDAELRNKSIDSIGDLDLVHRAGALKQARKMRDSITVVMALLEELEEIAPDEVDLSSFEELACLFDDVAGFATHGACSARFLAQTPLMGPPRN